MSTLDWCVLFGTLGAIVAYGVWKTKGSQNIEGFLLGDKSMRWWTIGLSVMATQASAITFLSTPGQAYKDGMGFVQFYFGLPIAMVILCITFVPIFHKLKVYTAYEYLEGRFDLKTRLLGSVFFLVQRGLAAGITIYAPAIVLSTLLDLNLTTTNLIIGVLVIIYTVSGGTKAVSQTQKYQMAVMMGGMVLAGILIVYQLPQDVSLVNAVKVAGKMGKLNLVSFEFDLNDRYNFWSGIISGTFLMLAYFGTDQSQVQRYLSGKSIAQSRLGLLFNGLFKVPMQFLILFIGVLVFIFYQFHQPPVFYNEGALQEVRQSDEAEALQQLEQEQAAIFEKKRVLIYDLIDAMEQDAEQEVEAHTSALHRYTEQQAALEDEVEEVISAASPDAETRDTDYIFITFVMNHLPQGIVGLLFAVIFSAAMSSTSGELNALASTSTVDFYKRLTPTTKSDKNYLNASRWFTLAWGLIAISFATFASLLDNLIQAVNILGSLFYGTVLGLFLVAFYIKFVRGTAVFVAALVGEAVVLYCFFFTDIAYLHFNIIGCATVVLLSMMLQGIWGRGIKKVE
jgi:SSS family transporter